MRGRIKHGCINMLPGILALGTAVPSCHLDQNIAAELMVEFLSLKGSRAERLRQLYSNTSINHRGTVVCDDEGQIYLPFSCITPF